MAKRKSEGQEKLMQSPPPPPSYELYNNIYITLQTIILKIFETDPPLTIPTWSMFFFSIRTKCFKFHATAKIMIQSRFYHQAIYLEGRAF